MQVRSYMLRKGYFGSSKRSRGRREKWRSNTQTSYKHWQQHGRLWCCWVWCVVVLALNLLKMAMLIVLTLAAAATVAMVWFNSSLSFLIPLFVVVLVVLSNFLPYFGYYYCFDHVNVIYWYCNPDESELETLDR